MCCFVLDGSPHLIHALWRKRPDLAAHIANVELHKGNALCHTTRNTLLEIDVLEFKSYLQGTGFNPSTNICHAIQKCNRSVYRAWFMNVYQK